MIFIKYHRPWKCRRIVQACYRADVYIRTRDNAHAHPDIRTRTDVYAENRRRQPEDIELTYGEINLDASPSVVSSLDIFRQGMDRCAHASGEDKSAHHLSTPSTNTMHLISHAPPRRTTVKVDTGNSV